MIVFMLTCNHSFLRKTRDLINVVHSSFLHRFTSFLVIYSCKPSILLRTMGRWELRGREGREGELLDCETRELGTCKVTGNWGGGIGVREKVLNQLKLSENSPD